MGEFYCVHINSLIKREIKERFNGLLWPNVGNGANYKPMDKIRTNEMVLIMNESTNERENGKFFLIG